MRKNKNKNKNNKINKKIEKKEVVENAEVKVKSEIMENETIENIEVEDKNIENKQIESVGMEGDKEIEGQPFGIEFKMKEVMKNSMENLEKNIESIIIDVLSSSGENIKKSLEKHIDEVKDEIKNIKEDIDNVKNDLDLLINDRNNIIIFEIKNKLDDIEKRQNQQNTDNKRSIFSLIKGQNENKKLDSIFMNLVNNIDNKFNLISKDTSKGFKRTMSKIDEVNDILDEIKTEDNQNKILQNIELLEGKIKSVDKINENVEKISKEFNKNEVIVSNLEDEILVNLGEYGKKILNQLILSARCYAQNKDCIESIDNERKEYQNKIEQTKKDSEIKGISEGKLGALKEIIDKCDGIDKIYDSKKEFEIIIRDILKNNGYERDRELLVGKEIAITEENKDDIQKKALNCEELGRYKVKKSAILLNEKIEKRDLLEKIDDIHNEDRNEDRKNKNEENKEVKNIENN